ncbi:MAG: efflux RND transporter periplasmic adaptor subunit [Spirochaetaceae bacterium]
MKHFFPYLILLIPFVLLVSCGVPEDEQTTTDNDEQRQIAVRALVMEPRTIRDVITLAGEIEASAAVDALPDTAGELTFLGVSTGDRVERGEVIARVDPSQPGRRFSESPVQAPIDGTVVSVPAQTGQQVTPQLPIARIAALERAELVMRVPERFVGQVSEGQLVRARFDAYPDVVFTARVRRRAPQLDASSRTLEVRARFDRFDERILTGMSARAELVLTERTDALVVPQESLIRRDGETFVYVVDGGDVALRRDVETGIESDGNVEIIDGLTAGDQVVTRGQNLLEDGTPVLVIR